MAEANLSIAALRGRHNGTDSKLPTGELAEAIELMEQAIGILNCLEVFGEPDVNVSGLSLLRPMAQAASGASQLVTRAQAFLIEADVIEAAEVNHG